MELWIGQSWEVLKVLASIATGFATFLPYSSASHATRGERWFFLLIASVVTFLLLPDDLSRCLGVTMYRQRAVLCAVIAVIGGVIFIAITRQYAHDQANLDDDKQVVKTILGGPRLTTEALEMRAKQPKLTTQELFARLGNDPHRMWEKPARVAIIVIHRLAALVTGLALVAAFVCAASAVLLAEMTRRSHRPLSLEPSSVQTLLEGERSIPINAMMHECDPRIVWTIDGPSWARTPAELGEVSSAGNYFSPPTIRRNVDLYVIATPVAHPDERRQLKVQLRVHPDYGRSHQTTGTDETGKRATLVIEILDQRYSWVIGQNRLQNADGTAFARRMADDGIFNGVKHIICVGAASREYISKSMEEQRAMDRAYTLARWIRDAVPQRQSQLWALKVGRYDDERRLSATETASERQVVVVGVLQADDNINMLEALRDAFERKRQVAPVLGKYLDKYPFDNWRLVSIN